MTRKRFKSLASTRKKNAAAFFGKKARPTGKIARQNSIQIAKREAVAEKLKIDVKAVGARVGKYHIYGFTPEGKPIVSQKKTIPHGTEIVQKKKPMKFSILRKNRKKNMA